MAVQQNKKSPSKRGMHRSHNALVVPGIAVEPTTGEIHLRHHISPTGFYRGRGSPIRRIGFERWQRNLAVALGNALRVADAETLGGIVNQLALRLASASELVREHIGWALAQRDLSDPTAVPPAPPARAAH